MDRRNQIVSKVWVICHHCGKEHLLFPGVGAPIYWCGDSLYCLVEGDEVLYDE